MSCATSKYLDEHQSEGIALTHVLCSRIYSYLLDGKNVRTTRKFDPEMYNDNFANSRTGPRANHFHTNVLAVNRTIHDEAEELLYKRNIFVVVSYKWFRLGKDIGGLSWLPIVSNRHVGRMRLHSMRIHVSGVSDLPETTEEMNASKQLQSCILLTSDLESFQLVMDIRGLTVAVATDVAGIPYFPDPEPMLHGKNPSQRCLGVSSETRNIAAWTPRHSIGCLLQCLQF